MKNTWLKNSQCEIAVARHDSEQQECCENIENAEMVMESIDAAIMKGATAIAPGPALEALKKALQSDYEFAWSWHCNLACCAMDEGIDHDSANIIAQRIMQFVFQVDTSQGY